MLAEGTTTAMHPKRAEGVTRPAAGDGDLPFGAGDVQGAEFAELRVGQGVTFDPEPDPRTDPSAGCRTSRIVGSSTMPPC